MSSEKSSAYRVEVAAGAILDLRHIYGYIGAENSQSAARWFNRLEELIQSLRTLPARGARVEEDPTLRQLLHGNKPHVYRII